MDCRTFRKHHTAFVDGAASDEQTAGMYGHLERCERCAKFDVVIRRGLLVARNLPAIRPSPDFAARLEARLRTGTESGWEDAEPRWIGARVAGRAFTAVRYSAAVAVVVAGIAMMQTRQRPYANQTVDSSMGATGRAADAMVAFAATGALQERTLAAVTLPTRFAASLVTGIPMWPGIRLIDRPADRWSIAPLQTASLSP